MKSLMVRLLMLVTVAMLLAIPGPAAMANHLDDNDLDDLDGLNRGNFGIFSDDFDGLNRGDFGILSDVLDEDFDDDDGDDLRVIEVGDEECLVDDDDVLFCDEEDDGGDAQAWLDAFFANNAAERGF
jgi:hypothetical protein